jgi:hypothetical protein
MNVLAVSLFCLCITGMVCPIWRWHVSAYGCLGKTNLIGLFIEVIEINACLESADTTVGGGLIWSHELD